MGQNQQRTHLSEKKKGKQEGEKEKEREKPGK